MGFEIVGSSKDIGNGLDFEYSRLKEVTKAAEDREFDVLLIKNFDRLGRNTVKTLDEVPTYWWDDAAALIKAGAIKGDGKNSLGVRS